MRYIGNTDDGYADVIIETDNGKRITVSGSAVVAMLEAMIAIGDAEGNNADDAVRSMALIAHQIANPAFGPEGRIGRDGPASFIVSEGGYVWAGIHRSDRACWSMHS